MSSPTDWSHFYRQNLSDQVPVFGLPYGTTVATSTVTSSAVVSVPGNSTGGGHLSPEGRVGKPARKRSRASRRTPTTMFNTDTANFRAMVQQFTGSPSFAQGSARPGGPAFGFSLGGRQSHLNPGSLTAPPVGFQLPYQQQQQQHQNQVFMFSLNNNDNNLRAGDHMLQRHPERNMEAGSEGFVAAGVSSQVPPSRTSSSNENMTHTSFSF
ncbi:Choline-phosphate cytidylyltransferase B [Hibiscus syriacus]|uniref:Choline-phosphate cytidylyltransferase B n=1 Tax=Hibiscus syriacus TaxID=106335 RepID=A0A6A2YYK8_HIBSY|nr:VQ motif-containing protein 22-like [Hibiscus syriacus]KAE8684648.1 Choline-phosphate cytidylyltransferase B [Hibiscus syriacus]